MAEAENIKMTVVINPLVSPLLFDALASCKSARARASQLKALAERALREQLAGGRTEGDPTSGVTSALAAAAVPRAPQLEPGVQVLRIPESADGGGFLQESLGSQFAGFFA